MAEIVGTITNLSDFLSKTQVCLSVKPNDPQQQIICLEADRKYSIPAFQREVRWDDNNLKMLLYDLSRSSKFLGNIILTIKSDHTCEIIDGQQRTTVLKYYEQEIAKATRTNTALRKKELVDSLVNEIKLQATTALKQEIVRKTNEKLHRVIVDDYVEIESIDRYIKLKGRDGASEGQTLSIAYCFLGTLFEDSELEFPFIIDSPTGKMDFEKRQAVADIIPLVFNQMIAFVQSAEVERFADRFYANPDSQYLTVVASPQDQAVVVYEGIDFFDSYQREHKGDEK